MTIPSVSSSQLSALMRQHGHAGWGQACVEHGKSFLSGGTLYTCDPALVRTVLLERVHTEKRSRVYQFLRNLPGADGVLFRDGESWLRQTRAVQPAFKASQLSSHAAWMHAHTVQHLRALSDGTPRADLYRDMVELGVNTVLHVGYGLRVDEPAVCRYARQLLDYKSHTMNQDPRRRLDLLGMGLEKLLHLPMLLHNYWEESRMVRRMRDTVATLRDAGAPDRPGWMRDIAGADFGLPEATDALNHIYGAFNAIDYVVTCALHELARRPAWQQRLRDEVTRVLGEAGPVHDDLGRLPDVQRFFLEVLRRYPVAMAVLRRAGAAFEHDGQTFPAAQEVALMLYALHHHPDFWDRPDEFDPDRWATPQPREPFSFVPFLHGPRKCTGQQLAELHFLVVICAVVRHVELTVDAPLLRTPYAIPRIAQVLPYRMRVLAA
ncbi:MAG: cytochrome P450 [Myxococcota bacterium]